jgi:hypothetical protein
MNAVAGVAADPRGRKAGTNALRRMALRLCSFADHHLSGVFGHSTLRRIWFCCLLTLFQTISFEPQDACRATVSTIDEVAPTRFAAHQPDVVPNVSSGETPIGYKRRWRSVVDRLTNRLGQDGNLIKGRRLVQAPFCRRFCRTFDSVLLGLG